MLNISYFRNALVAERILEMLNISYFRNALVAERILL